MPFTEGDTMTDADWKEKSRRVNIGHMGSIQANKDYRRSNELVKKRYSTGLSEKEKAELKQLGKDTW